MSQGLTLADLRSERNAALKYACRYGHLPVVAYLLVYGLTAGDVRCRDNEALKLACHTDDLEIIQELVTHAQYRRDEFTTIPHHKFIDSLNFSRRYSDQECL